MIEKIYCCKAFQRQLEMPDCHNHSREKCPDIIIIQMANGEYAIPIKDGGSSAIAISHCPFCGVGLKKTMMDTALTPRPECVHCKTELFERTPSGWTEKHSKVLHDAERCRDVLVVCLRSAEAFWNMAISELGVVLQPRNAQPWTLGDMVNAARELKEGR